MLEVEQREGLLWDADWKHTNIIITSKKERKRETREE